LGHGFLTQTQTWHECWYKNANVSGAEGQKLFGVTDINQTTNKQKEK